MNTKEQKFYEAYGVEPEIVWGIKNKHGVFPFKGETKDQVQERINGYRCQRAASYEVVETERNYPPITLDLLFEVAKNNELIVSVEQGCRSTAYAGKLGYPAIYSNFSSSESPANTLLLAMLRFKGVEI